MNLSKILYISSLLALGLMVIYATHYIASTSGPEKNEKSHEMNVAEVGNKVIVTLKIRNNYDERKNYAYEIVIDESQKFGNSLAVPSKDTVDVGASISKDRIAEKIAILLYRDEKLLESTNYYASKGGK